MLGSPQGGSKVWKVPDREIDKPGENRREVIAHRDLQPAAAFHHRENRRNLRSCQWLPMCNQFLRPRAAGRLCHVVGGGASRNVPIRAVRSNVEETEDSLAP